MGFRGESGIGAPPARCKLRLVGASFGPAGHEQMAGPMTWPFSATSLSPAPRASCALGVAQSKWLERSLLPAAHGSWAWGTQSEAFYSVPTALLEDSWFPCTGGRKEDPWQALGEGVVSGLGTAT